MVQERQRPEHHGQEPREIKNVSRDGGGRNKLLVSSNIRGGKGLAWVSDTTGDELMQGACCRVIDIGGSFESTIYVCSIAEIPMSTDSLYILLLALAREFVELYVYGSMLLV
jgi:hypothetical protein